MRGLGTSASAAHHTRNARLERTLHKHDGSGLEAWCARALRAAPSASGFRDPLRAPFIFFFFASRRAHELGHRDPPRADASTPPEDPDLTSVRFLFCIAVVLTKKKPTGGMNGVPKSADAVRLTPHSTLP